MRQNGPAVAGGQNMVESLSREKGSQAMNFSGEICRDGRPIENVAMHAFSFPLLIHVVMNVFVPVHVGDPARRIEQRAVSRDV
jgi:hypothetical protein